uniref:Putative microtubule-associated protein 70-2-like n=1 Tax=Solanum chacoense TaxID=4108 RepID=A0A0V0I0T5_SOLCH
MKQIEICQEENKILDKMHRLKVAEVEKLTQTVRELEEAVLAGGAAANAVREYQRKVQELNEEKRILDRELARAKISANRVAVVVANDWKDAPDKVMPVKQWLEERKYYQGEMQQLKDKLAIAERAAKAEAQLKEKYQLRFKVLEERFKVPSNVTSRTAAEGRSISNVRSRCMSLGGVENLSRPSNGSLLRKTSFQSGSSQSNDASSLLKKAKNLSGAFDGGSRSEGKEKPVQLTDQKDNGHSGTSRESHSNGIVTAHKNADLNAAEKMKLENKDYVCGAVYDMLQKEVIVLRKACNEKDHSLKDKDDAIEMLAKKVETLNKAMAIEAKRMRREVAAMEKEVATIRNGKEYDQRLKCSYSAKGAMNGHTLPQRNDRSYKNFTEQ